jgi:hypothetical protein
MHNPEKLATLSKQDTDTKKQKQTPQHNTEKKEQLNPPKTGGEPGCLRKVSGSCFL